MQILEVYWKGQARVIHELAQSWRAESDVLQAMRSCEATVDHVLATCEALRHLSDHLWRDVFSGRMRSVLQTGVQLRETMLLFAEAVESLSEALGSHEPFAESDRHLALLGVAQSLRLWEAEAKSRWPWFDPDEIEALSKQPMEFVGLEELCEEFPELRRMAEAKRSEFND